MKELEARRQSLLNELDRAFAPNRIAQALIVVGLTPADLAAGTGANVRTVTSWLENGVQSPKKEEHRIRLQQIKEIVRFVVANGTITYQEADWMRYPNRLQDFRTPLEMVAEGRWREAGRLFCDDVVADVPEIFTDPR